MKPVVEPSVAILRICSSSTLIGSVVVTSGSEVIHFAVYSLNFRLNHKSPDILLKQ
jgi:carbonic anhydrase/acetyltransferase-like protein (isoleucine patch superfamily)